MPTPARSLVIVALAIGVGCGADPSAPSGPSGQQPSGSEPAPEASVDVASAAPEPSAPDTSTDAATLATDGTSDGALGPVTDGPRPDAASSTDAPLPGGWQLVWSDEFNGVAGTK